MLTNARSRVRNAGYGVFSLLLMCVPTSGCLSPATSSQSITPATSSDTTTTGATASISADLYLKIDWAWEDSASSLSQYKLCSIPSGSGGTLGAPVTLNCTMSMPEARMYHGKFRFTWGSSNPDLCKIVIFQPYYYAGSLTDAAYVAPYDATQTEVDCSTAPFPAGCYNGAARFIVPSFPENTALYVITDQSQEGVSTLESAHHSSIWSNRMMANNLIDQVNGIAGEYVGNSMVNWSMQCRDEYYTLRQVINLTVSDEDEVSEDPGGPEDHFSDWNGS